MGDKFWLNDISVLIKDKRYLDFFPTKNMSHNEILNSLTRFSLYLIILFLLFINWDSYYFFIPIIIIVICILMNKLDDSKLEEKCTRPSKTNPYMNVSLYDLENNKDRKGACSYDDPEINKESTKYFEDNLYTNVDDIYQNRNSQRQFYTMPVSTIPSKQDEFAKFCYGTKAEDQCKTNQEACLRYEDVRYKQFNDFAIKK